jgi:hypothetical protein
VELAALGSSPVALRGAGAPAWSLPELVPAGLVTSLEEKRVVLTADGGAVAVLAAYPTDALEQERRRLVVVPILGPGA